MKEKTRQAIQQHVCKTSVWSFVNKTIIQYIDWKSAIQSHKTHDFWQLSLATLF